MICKLHIVHTFIEIYVKNYVFLSSYLHLKFRFNHRKVVKQKKVKFLRNQINNSYLSQWIRNLCYVNGSTNSRPTEYHRQSLIWYLYTFISRKPRCNMAIVLYIHHILWTNQHFEKKFVRIWTTIMFIKKCI